MIFPSRGTGARSLAPKGRVFLLATHMQFASAHLLAQFGGAWRWWTGELCALVPQSLRQMLASPRGRLLLIVEADGANLAYEAGRRREPLGRIAPRWRGRRQDGSSPRCPPPRGYGGGSTSARARPALGSGPAARRREKFLDQVIGYEFERLTPFRRDDVYYAYRLLRRDAMAQRLHLELIVVPRVQAEQVLRLARRAGLRVAALEGGWGTGQ